MNDKSEHSIGAFRTVAVILILIGGLTLILALSYFICKSSDTKSGISFDSNVFGDYGSLIGGTVGALWSLAGVLLFYAALGLQREDLVAQKKEFELTRMELAVQNKTLSQQRFENTFFHLIDLHNDIVDKLLIIKPDESNDKFQDEERQRPYAKRELFDYAVEYLFEFQGINNHYEKDEHYQEIILDAYNTFNVKFSTHLNHYFRNLYHIYRYIYHSTLIDKTEKSFYASIVRAQLSDNELIIIFYNMFIPGLGYPNFKFLDQEYDILKNLDHDSPHREVFERDIVDNPFEK